MNIDPQITYFCILFAVLLFDYLLQSNHSVKAYFQYLFHKSYVVPRAVLALVLTVIAIQFDLQETALVFFEFFKKVPGTVYLCVFFVLLVCFLGLKKLFFFPYSHPLKNLCLSGVFGGIFLLLLLWEELIPSASVAFFLKHSLPFHFDLTDKKYQIYHFILQAGCGFFFLSFCISVFAIGIKILNFLKKALKLSWKAGIRHRRKIVSAILFPFKYGLKKLKSIGSRLNRSARKSLTAPIEPYFTELDDLINDLATLLAKIDPKTLVLELFELRRKERDFKRSVSDLKRDHRQSGTTTLYRHQKSIEATLSELVEEGTDLLEEAVTLLQTQLENVKEKESEPCKEA